MPPEAVRLLEAMSLWLLVGLALPKRRLPGLRGRLTGLAGGERRWLCAAPLSWGRTAVQRRRLVAESLRVVELGVPLWVVARVLEERSARRRLEAKALWMDGRSALFYSRTTERISEQELSDRLALLGYPPPEAKAMPLLTARRPTLPLDWWAETHSEVPANGEASDEATAESDLLVATGNAVDLASHLPDPNLLSIRTFGRLQLLLGDQDFSEQLLRKPVPAFIWLFLLVRALARPGDRLTRSELAEELTPGLAPERQRKRLRDRLSDMLHGEIPTELATRIILQSDECVSLDLGHATSDFDRLVRISRERNVMDGLLAPDQTADVVDVLASTEAEFLPEWDRLEEQVTGARGSAGEMVRQLRVAAESERIGLLEALAANHLARREADRAASILERALERRPHHEGLARKLVAAYMQAGQTGRAADLQRLHGLES